METMEIREIVPADIPARITMRGPTLRAYGFYRKHGWLDDKIQDGNRYMIKKNPGKAVR